MPCWTKIYAIFGTVTARAFRKKSKARKHIQIDTMLRSGFFSEKHARWRSRVLDFLDYIFTPTSLQQLFWVTSRPLPYWKIQESLLYICIIMYEFRSNLKTKYFFEISAKHLSRVEILDMYLSNLAYLFSMRIEVLELSVNTSRILLGLTVLDFFA